MLSVIRGVEFVNPGGPIFYAAFARFPNPCLLHAKLPSGLCGGDRRTRTASTLVAPPVGDLITGLFSQPLLSTPAVLLVALLPLSMLSFSWPGLSPHLVSSLLPSRGAALSPGPVFHRCKHVWPLFEKGDRKPDKCSVCQLLHCCGKIL